MRRDSLVAQGNKNLPANAGNSDSILPGRFHLLREQLSLYATVTEPSPRTCKPQLLKPMRSRTPCFNKIVNAVSRLLAVVTV